jgi:hypothetical protein
MAKCPECSEAQDWWKLLRFDKTQLMICQRCGSILAMDSQRATILLGGFVAILALPETKLLSFDWSPLWFICVLAVYTPFYIIFTKLCVVSDGELEITHDQEVRFNSYAIGRNRFNIVGNALLWGGLLTFLAGMSLFSNQGSEVVSVFSLLAMMVGLGVLVLTRCPFCRKLTVRIPFGDGRRCINCHRDIDVSE